MSAPMLTPGESGGGKPPEPEPEQQPAGWWPSWLPPYDSGGGDTQTPVSEPEPELEPEQQPVGWWPSWLPPYNSGGGDTQTPVSGPTSEQTPTPALTSTSTTTHQQDNMINHDINYVVAGRGRPKSAGRIDTVQEMRDTVKEYRDIETQFVELFRNDRISQELFYGYRRGLMEDNPIPGFFSHLDYVEKNRDLIGWIGLDADHTGIDEIRQSVNEFSDAYQHRGLLDWRGLNPQNSDAEVLAKAIDENMGRYYHQYLPAYYGLQIVEFLTEFADAALEEGPDIITDLGSHGATRALESLSHGDVEGAVVQGGGFVATMASFGIDGVLAGGLAIGDGVVDSVEAVLYGTTHEVHPIARMIRGAYQVGTFYVMRGAKGKAAKLVKNEALHTSLFQNVPPKFRNVLIGISVLSGTSIEDMIGLWRSSPVGLSIDKVMGLLPTPAEVENIVDALLNPNSEHSAEDLIRATELGGFVETINDAIPRPPDEADIGMNHPQPEMPDVNSILEAQPWVDSAEYYVTQREYCFAMELYNEALSIYPDLKGEIDQPGTYYQEAINNCPD